MRERGIIFNAEMVRAVLEGRKTQTRRAIKHQPFIDGDFWKMDHAGWGRGLQLAPHGAKAELYLANHCPFGAVGDRLWVRETFATLCNEDGCAIDWDDNLVKGGGARAARIYRACCEQREDNYGLWSIPDDAFWKPHTDNMQYEGTWVPSIYMPRWASRITLEITDVRVERLQDIGESDAVAEGIEPLPLEPDMPQFYHEYFPIGIKNGLRCNMSAASSFSGLWEAIYGKESWQANPWVWVIEFKRVEGVHVQTS